jgi:hypothetical protein
VGRIGIGYLHRFQVAASLAHCPAVGITAEQRKGQNSAANSWLFRAKRGCDGWSIRCA